MSYLLEALRKAERDRQLGQPPSLESVDLPTGKAPRDQRRLVLALAATAVMLLSLILVLLLTRQSAPAAAPVPAAPAAPIAAPLPEPLPEPAGPSSLDELAAVQPPTPEPLVEPAPARPAAPPRREAAKPEPARELAAPDLPEQAAPEPEPIKDEAPSAPPLRELPADYRADFPPLSIEVLVYDADPAKRWIMVDTRRYREGETLSEGPRIAEIRADGVVFEHRGQRALVTVGR